MAKIIKILKHLFEESHKSIVFGEKTYKTIKNGHVFTVLFDHELKLEIGGEFQYKDKTLKIKNLIIDGDFIKIVS